MTVTATTSRISYAGNGSTVTFAVPFYFLVNSDLVLIKTTAAGVQTTLTLTTDYTVSGAGVLAGGSVTLVTAPGATDTLVIYRDPAVTQAVDYQPNDPFPAETHERALDKLTMITQRLKDLITRSFRLSDGDTTTASTTLPSPSSNKLIGWNATATGLQNVDQTTLATIVAFGTANADVFTGNGVQTAFTLSANPGAQANLDVSVGGVTQTPGTHYNWASGTTVTFTAAPPNGVPVLIRYFQALPQGSTDSAASTFTPSGASAQPTNVQAKLRQTVSVFDFMTATQIADVTSNTGSINCAVAIQAALDSSSRVYFPNGTYKITTSLNVNSYNVLQFESRNAIIKGALTAPLIQGKSGTTTRTYHAQIYGGTLDNTSTANAGGIGIDWKSMSMAKTYGTFITNCETGIKNGGTSSQGSFYNEFYGVDLSTVVIGIDNGTLGNDNKFFGGRVNSCTTGTRDNDCSGNLYCGVAIEVFTTGHLTSNTAAATNIKYIGSRLENAPTSGTGIDIRALAQITSFYFPTIIGVTTPISDAATAKDTNGWSDYGLMLKSSTPIKRRYTEVITKTIAPLAAGATRQEQFLPTNVLTGDAVTLTVPNSWPSGLIAGPIINGGSGLVYVQLYNPTAGTITPVSADYRFDIWRN